MKIHELKYSGTNTYLIEGEKGRILFDTGWAGTFHAFCQAVGGLQIPVQGIDYILISHFHPDHMGIAQKIADLGPVIAVTDVQRDYVHAADSVFDREKNSGFIPIRDEKIRWVRLEESRAFLKELGIDGELLHTPGHSDDSISLSLDDGSLFVGDLNPLYELELHKGSQIEESWKKLLARKPHTVYYGHARTWRAEENPDFYKDAGGRSGTGIADNTPGSSTQKGDTHSTQKDDTHSNSELYALVSQIMKLIDKGVSLERIRKKTGAAPVFIEDVARMYLTHQNVGVQGILDRIEIKGK
ncbi:MAG: MBL fold metallo-hydrolase [Lachnospiraceae bacterium]|nr:MBL fold metallo-hydrolase [Lachnospiraceae bacterium]